MPDTRKINVGVLGAKGPSDNASSCSSLNTPFFVLHVLGRFPPICGEAVRKGGQLEADEANTCRRAGDGRPGLQSDTFSRVFHRFLRVGCRRSRRNRCAHQTSFRLAELAVFSNAKNHRRDPHVPLIVPLVNSAHLSMIPQQRALHSPLLRKGFIVTNANCSTTGFVVPLAALEKAFGPIESCMITTMQAISGAGYPGVPSLDIVDNVVPYISGEEEKMEWETLKILGGITESDDGTKTFDMHGQQPLRISASCNRVPVIEGHTECVSVRFARRPPPSPQQVREALVAFTSDAYTIGCPSAPRHTIFVHEEPDPAAAAGPRLPGRCGCVLGRVRQCRVLDIKFVVLANNVAIGAAQQHHQCGAGGVKRGGRFVALRRKKNVLILPRNNGRSFHILSSNRRANRAQGTHIPPSLSQNIPENFLAENLRLDGRDPDQWRGVSVNVGSISTADGSALARVGDTTVVCGVKAEIAEPELDRPKDGFLVPNLDLPAMCSPKFKPGPPTDEAQVLSDRLNEVLLASGIVPTSSLCIEPGKAVWVLYVVRCASTTTATPSTRLSWRWFPPSEIVRPYRAVPFAHHTEEHVLARLPKATFNDETGRTVCSRKEKIPLQMHRLPMSVSFGIFDSSYVLADPSSFEEPLLDGTLSVTVDEHGGLVSVTQLGLGLIHGQEIITGCIAAAKDRCAELAKQIYNTS
ncbi:putative aspartate-semialdehyde dehydrogenase [Grifola frondosa]|uniref:Putative aspartate-semialdehyde dehydrogenase n=1 Tax=Grifola frondosa TaxID=5627 RepID=A0A1C7M0L5_GRIFR|nr:putative aspartate-semialdehyde dehydrogenase [Grifola frondosa]